MTDIMAYIIGAIMLIITAAVGAWLFYELDQKIDAVVEDRKWQREKREAEAERERLITKRRY